MQNMHLVSWTPFFLIFIVPKALCQYDWGKRHPLNEGGRHVCKEYCYYYSGGQCKFNNHCNKHTTSWWWWDSCSSYNRDRAFKLSCCPGYSNNGYEKECNYAVCGGRINPNGACNINYLTDRIIYRPDKNGHREQRRSGGTCLKPNHCIDCNDGFYSDGPYCRICPKINHCLDRRCTDINNNRCEYCDGEIRTDVPTWNAYIRGINGNFKECARACSWRKDSTRCYPGNCADHEKASSCKCADGFGGVHCDKIVKDATVSFALAKLKGSSDPVETPADPNEPQKNEVKWTNQKIIKSAELQSTSVFRSKSNITKPDETGQNHYITEFQYGIIRGEVRLSFVRDSDLNYTLTPLVIRCIPPQPTTDRFDCGNEVSIENKWGVLSHFSHDDKVIFSYSITNGGWLKYIDRDLYPNPEVNIAESRTKVTLQGRTVTTEFIIHWDLEKPYHTETEQNGINCTVPPIDSPGVTNNSEVLLKWTGWTDDLAGIDHYSYELYELTSRGSLLAEDSKVKDGKILSNIDGSMNLNITSPGMYSLVFYALDKAGNDKASRTVFLFDDISKVESISGEHIRVVQTSSATKYEWVVVDDQLIHVTWKRKFKNERHYAKNWLESIKARPNLDKLYDDRYGVRTTDSVPNRKGIVRFETSFIVLSPTITQQQSFLETDSVLDESTSLPVTWDDGARLDITVRAFDILDEYIDETISVYKDSSPPMIENLWLTRGDRLNISVHSVEDFTLMTIEWNAFDFHSGVDNLHWRLFDNFTKTDVLHGHENLHSQGNAMNISECEQKYGEAPRGPDCYCTSFHGCYHQHFYVVPKINNMSGLIIGKDKGVHDSDYYIEVTVVNKANLKTVVSKKITIDISPPHEGSVHDGIRGSPEIDYQEDLDLNAHWEGFFDRESGVEFYEYIFDDHCYTNDEFKNTTKTTETYNTFAKFRAPREGKYYISVVAVNRAKENSNVVCSDGVTITTKVPKITDFVLAGATTRPRLVTDNSSIWYLDGNLIRHKLMNSSISCSTLMVTDVAVLPKGNPISLDNRICSDSKDVHVFAVLRRVSQFSMSWNSTVSDHLVHDYEIGLSSTENSMAPDIYPFKTTKHHAHFRLNHPDVPCGKEFYIVIKSISKSGTEGIPSIGPLIVDVTKPRFVGDKIEVKLSGKYLVAYWSLNAFEDPDDPYPMTYQFAVGHQPYTYDLSPFRNLIYGGPCTRSKSSACTVLPISDLKWSLHGHHQYYFTVKATNLAGLSAYQTSEPYIHDVQLPAEGVVIDISTTGGPNNVQKDIEDIDFTTDNSSLAVKWSGFLHPHQNATFRACVGTSPKSCDVKSYESLSFGVDNVTFTGLALQNFQVYYVTLEASTSAGSVVVSTDGIQLLDINKELIGIIVREGDNCTDSVNTGFKHHEQDTRPKCTEDVDFQTSTTSLHVYWTIPDQYQTYIKDTWIELERRLVDDVWVNFTDFQFVGIHNFITLSNLNMEAGHTYRPVLKFCTEGHCFPVVHGNGATVIVNPPRTGNMSLILHNDSLIVEFDRMVDPDIPIHEEAAEAINLYEWAIGDNVGIHTIWQAITNVTITDKKHLQFLLQLNSTMDFSKCRKVFIRGYNKAGVWSTISREIKECLVTDGNSLIIPKLIIDAIGEQEISLDGVQHDGYGKDIFLETNDRWEEADEDYTPFKNVISATWPLLRNHNYTWAVIDAENLDVTSYYQNEDTLQLTDPCSHPDAIKCGHTEKEYMNAYFASNEELSHGKRYIVCVHATRKEIQYEKWTEVLHEVNSCSDGVTVDLTPPTPGQVWIGIDPTKLYQSSTSDIFMSWQSFTDVEEYGSSVHSSGIKEYFIGVGSTEGGTDITPYTSVGLVNHFTVKGLRLQDGHEYYASVKAIDFAGRSSTVSSHPIKIDSSPPEISDKPITIKGRHLSQISEIDACWRDVFLDTESGIDHYLWAVGSHPGHDDIIPFTMTTVDCGVSAEDSNIDIKEGHAYFITVKSINRAGLISTASSWAYVYDMSPPVPGHVYDGTPEHSPIYSKDIDFQTDTKSLSSYWEGFHDPHTVIRNYYVSIGTCYQCEDVLPNQDIGISQNFTLCHVHLGLGIRYFTTITACNTADICTSVTSDGVVIDNSAPSQGVVLDGVDKNDIEYQSLRNYIAARWYGFMDAQSGIDHYTWRVGTQPGKDDIIRSSHLPLTNILVEPDIKSLLPKGKRIYFTVKAHNKAGLSTEAVSNGFVVDDTPPNIKVNPYLSTDLGSINDNSVVFRSTIRVKWEVEDSESYIQRQYISLSSHKGGHFNTSSTELNGIVREFTLTRLDLHDGGDYTVNLIVCNGAKMCVEGKSQSIKVDSSPPTPGMFAIETDHAANLHRHVEGWMTWSRYKLWLSWLGFTDLHTRIDKYYVSVGSQYMTDDLNKIPGSPQEFLHNISDVDKGDEGFVQTFEIDVKNLAKIEDVFVSVWAVNEVGLPSPMIHSQFKLVAGGSLDLIRRCSSITCKGHCVCAAQGKRCSLNGNKCKDISKANVNSLLNVYDITDVRPASSYSDVNYTPSNGALAAKWHIVQAQGLKPLWYEWSAGLSKSTSIEGVFTGSDDVWHHAGQNHQAILNLRRGNELKEPGIGYSMIIRAWYDEDTYADFKTDGVQAISTPLSRRKIKGSAVVEQKPGFWEKDIDFIEPGVPFTINWSNVFKDDKNIIERFKVYISTSPGGHDIHAVELDLPGYVNSHNISRVPLTPGIVFYSNVVGYSWSGIFATETSDGVMVDSVPPVVGSVYDGIAIHDRDYQNSSDIVGASWHGSSDRESGVSHYMWCVQTKTFTNDTCDIRNWEKVGIHQRVSRHLNGTNLLPGTEYKSLVKAVDYIGHVSTTASSNGVTVDTTHPEPTTMEHLDDNMADNPSFENFINPSINWETINNVTLCSGSSTALPINWNYTERTCVSVLESRKNQAMDGRSFIFVEGEIYQKIKNIKVDHLYRVTFVTAHPPILGSVLANKEGYVNLDENRHVFLVYTKQDKHSTASDDLDWHHHTFYFRPVRPEVTIKLGTMTGKTGILFDDLKVQETVIHHNDDVSVNHKQIHAHVISLHEWSSIHASWNFYDPESPIVDYMWAIGYTEGSTEVQGFQSVGLSNFAYNYNVTLAHTSVIHITVVAINAAGLRGKAHAEDLLVDLTPPNIAYINDGIGPDISAQTSEEISSNWDVEDSESGIQYCEWAVGYQPYGNEVQTFQKLLPHVRTISKVFPGNMLSTRMVHVTLRCRNNAGLQSSLSTNGVQISNFPPNTTYADVEILPWSLTEYNARDHHQGEMSSLKVKWTGFEDVTGIDSYILSIKQKDHEATLTKTLTAENQDTSYCVIHGLDMTTGNYTASINAVNKMYLRSDSVNVESVVSMEIPELTETTDLSLTLDNRTLIASWKDHFHSIQPMYYEVSAGTTLGGADIIQWQETKNTYLEFNLPPKIKSVAKLTCYITVRGVLANGMSTILNTVIKLV